MLLDESSNARFDTLITAAIHNNKTLSQAASRFLHISHLLLPLRGVWIYNKAIRPCSGADGQRSTLSSTIAARNFDLGLVRMSIDHRVDVVGSLGVKLGQNV